MQKSTKTRFLSCYLWRSNNKIHAARWRTVFVISLRSSCQHFWLYMPIRVTFREQKINNATLRALCSLLRSEKYVTVYEVSLHNLQVDSTCWRATPDVIHPTTQSTTTVNNVTLCQFSNIVNVSLKPTSVQYHRMAQNWRVTLAELTRLTRTSEFSS